MIKMNQWIYCAEASVYSVVLVWFVRLIVFMVCSHHIAIGFRGRMACVKWCVYVNATKATIYLTFLHSSSAYSRVCIIKLHTHIDALTIQPTILECCRFVLRCCCGCCCSCCFWYSLFRLSLLCVVLVAFAHFSCVCMLRIVCRFVLRKSTLLKHLHQWITKFAFSRIAYRTIHICLCFFIFLFNFFCVFFSSYHQLDFFLFIRCHQVWIRMCLCWFICSFGRAFHRDLNVIVVLSVFVCSLLFREFRCISEHILLLCLA